MRARSLFSDYLRSGQRFFSFKPIQTKVDITNRWVSQQLESLPKKSWIKVMQADGAGTVFDLGCTAPLQVFMKMFSDRGFDLTHAQITGSMGLKKIDHIRQLLFQELFHKWKQKYGVVPTEEHVPLLHHEFITALNQRVADYSEPVPHIEAVMSFMKKHKILTALTTGYSRTTAELALQQLNKIHQFDESTTADEVREGTRIAMILANMHKLKLTIPMSQVAFFSDASSDMINVRENATEKSMPWIIGVYGYSTHVGIIDKKELASTPSDILEKKRENAKNILKNSGAHAVIRDMTEAPLAILAASLASSLRQTPAKTELLSIVQPPKSEFESQDAISTIELRS